MVEQASSRQFVEVSGGWVAVTRGGTGPVVVCLHVVGHSAGDFVHLADRLKHRFAFVCVDWPGHGDSPHEAVPASAQRYAEVLAATVDALELSNVIILGNSIGGAAAIAYAAAHPERVRALILCNPGGLQPVGFVARLVCRRMAAFFARGERDPLKFARQFRSYYEREVLPSSAATWRREQIIAAARQTAPTLRQAWEGFATPESDLRHLAPKIQCPVLLAWARNDRYVAWRRSKRAARSFPVHSVRLFGGGHAAFLEEPELFAEAFTQFLDRLTRSEQILPVGAVGRGDA